MSTKKNPDINLETEQSYKSVEVIKLIARTESDCAKKMEFAESEAKLIIAEAEERARKSADFETMKALDKIKKIKELTDEKSREIAVNILKQVNAECEELKKAARQKASAVVSVLAERIENEWMQ